MGDAASIGTIEGMRKGQRRILVIRPDRIGDVVLATPLIRALRQTFPDCYLGALVRPSVAPVLHHNPHLDCIITDDVTDKKPSMQGFFPKLKEVRSHGFNTGLMLLPTMRHAWMMLLAGIRTRIGVGTKLYQVLTLTRSVSRRKYNPLRYEADYCLDLGRRIGVRNDDLSLEVFITEEEHRSAALLLEQLGWDNTRRLIAVHPESGRSAPNWEQETYVQLAAAILQSWSDVQVMVNLTPGNAIGRALFQQLQKGSLLLPENGGDLRLLMALISHAHVAVSASTGPMHIASGLRVPVVAMFCPLTPCAPKLWGPATGRYEIVLPPEDYCGKRCPGDPHVCTFDGGIGVNDVLRALRSIMHKL